MPHIHTNPGEHDHTVSACIIRTDLSNEPRIVLHMHKKLRTLMQFGGHIELIETPWDAVAHEMVEESGYELNKLKLLQPKIGLRALTGAVVHPQPACVNTHSFPGNHYHTDSAYVFVADSGPTALIANGESVDIRNFTLQDLTNPDTNILPNVREISVYALSLLDEGSYDLIDPDLYHQTNRA